MMMTEAHTNHWTEMVMTTGPDQDPRTQTGRETDMILQTEEIGTTAIQAGQIIVIVLS